MNLNDLTYLVALREHRSFQRAAKACFVSQPTISTQIRKLEKSLKVTLVERSARGVVFTAAGEAVVERARQVLRDVAALELTAKQALEPESGPLHLGVFPTLGPYLLPHIIGPLHTRFPNIEFLLTEEKTGILTDKLKYGELDAALLADVYDDDLVRVPLFTEPFVFAASSGRELPKGPLTIGDLSGQELLLLDDGHCLRDQALSVCTQVRARERQNFRATSLETLRHMVGADVGVTLLPLLSTTPPVPVNTNIQLVSFVDPVYRDIALHMRPTSQQADVLASVAAEIKNIVTPLLP